MVRGVPGPLGRGLGAIMAPKGAPGTPQGCPRVPQGRPKGAKLEAKIHIFPIFAMLFCDQFSDMRLGRPPGGFFIDFG